MLLNQTMQLSRWRFISKSQSGPTWTNKWNKQYMWSHSWRKSIGHCRVMVRLCTDFAHYGVPTPSWVKMSAKQWHEGLTRLNFPTELQHQIQVWRGQTRGQDLLIQFQTVTLFVMAWHFLPQPLKLLSYSWPIYSWLSIGYPWQFFLLSSIQHKW